MKAIVVCALSAFAIAGGVGLSSVASATPLSEQEISSEAGTIYTLTGNNVPTRPGENNHVSRNGIGHGNKTKKAPSRPGENTHYPRNGTVLKNDGHPVTGKDSHKGKDTLRDTVHTAGGFFLRKPSHHRHQ